VRGQQHVRGARYRHHEPADYQQHYEHGYGEAVHLVAYGRRLLTGLALQRELLEAVEYEEQRERGHEYRGQADVDVHPHIQPTFGFDFRREKSL